MHRLWFIWWQFLMRNSGEVEGTHHYQSTHAQDERQDLCLEDGTSKFISIGNCRILFLEEILLQERELCTLQGVMDANNFNILWTEASWFGNSISLHIIPTKEIVSVWNEHLQRHITEFYIKRKETIFLSQTRKKKKTFLGGTWSLFCLVTSWVDWQVLSET